MIDQYLKPALHFISYLYQCFNRDGCRQSAAALTYMSLFAVVPLLTMIYAMFSVLPAFQGLGDQVSQLIFNNLIPESGAEVQEYLLDFSSKARKLSAAGVLILAVTSYLMLSNIERTFNQIWGTAGGRRGLSSFLLYWAVLSLGPLLIGAGLLMQTYLLSFRLFSNNAGSLGVVSWVFGYLPLLFTWLAFTLLFVTVPNCRVSVRYAAAGGLLTTLLFESAKGLFGFVISYTSYSSIYGAFAFFPVFLIWIYLLWVIVLGGAELVRALETFGTIRRGNRFPDLVEILIILWFCWQRQLEGTELSDRDMLKSIIQDDRWRYMRDLLLQEKYLAQTARGKYVLMRDISKISLWELGRLSPSHIAELPEGSELEKLQALPWYSRLHAMLEQANQQECGIFSPKVNQLFDPEAREESGKNA